MTYSSVQDVSSSRHPMDTKRSDPRPTQEVIETRRPIALYEEVVLEYLRHQRWHIAIMMVGTLLIITSAVIVEDTTSPLSRWANLAGLALIGAGLLLFTVTALAHIGYMHNVDITTTRYVREVPQPLTVTTAANGKRIMIAADNASNQIVLPFIVDELALARLLERADWRLRRDDIRASEIFADYRPADTDHWGNPPSPQCTTGGVKWNFYVAGLIDSNGVVTSRGRRHFMQIIHPK